MVDSDKMMYYYYITMNTSRDNQATIRTQISLTPEIKRAIEAKRRITGESLSAYLRKAALIRLAAEGDESRELSLLAKTFVGGSAWRKNHPYWKNKQAVLKWQRGLRSEWE